MSETATPTGEVSRYFSHDPPTSGLRTKALRGARFTVSAQVMNYGIQTVGSILLARLLTPRAFGLVTIVVAFGLLVQNIGVSGFYEVVVQRDRVDHRQLSTLFWLNASISLGLALVFMALARPISIFYGEPRLQGIAIAISPAILLAGLANQHLALLTRTMQFNKMAANEVVAMFTSFTVAIILAFLGWGYWAVVAKWVVAPFMTTAGAWVLCRWRPSRPSRGSGVKAMMKFVANTYGMFSMDYLRRNIDNMLIGKVRGSEQLGAYDRAFQLSMLFPQLVLTSLGNVSLVTFSQLQNDPPRYRENFLKVLSLLAFVSMPLSAIVTLTAHDVVRLLLGPHWAASGQILSILGVSSGVAVLYWTPLWLHMSLGTPHRLLRWNAVAFAVTATSYLVGVRFGAVGVAVAASACLYALIGPSLWYAGKPVQLTLTSVVSTVWTYCVAALAAGILSWFVLYSPGAFGPAFAGVNAILRIPITAALCSSTYLVVVALLHRSLSPIAEFAAVVRDMTPSMSLGR